MKHHEYHDGICKYITAQLEGEGWFAQREARLPFTGPTGQRGYIGPLDIYAERGNQFRVYEIKTARNPIMNSKGIGQLLRYSEKWRRAGTSQNVDWILVVPIAQLEWIISRIAVIALEHPDVSSIQVQALPAIPRPNATSGPILQNEDITLTKAARLAVLLEMEDAGLLKGRTLQSIANTLGGGLNRSTIMHDKRLLAEVRRRREDLRRKIELLQK